MVSNEKFLCNIFYDEGMGLSFTIAAGPRQCSYSRVRVPRAQLNPQALGSLFVASYDTRRATVEVFETASTRAL
jgi:hypothetical protein